MNGARKFGWFGGVFTPSILTILGVIMYLRLPSIVGQAGLATTLGIIALAHVISVTTGLSLASVATDKKVEAGGTYYMISRSLGLAIGGTLGIALFVGLSFAVSLYIIGFAESFLGFWGIEQSMPNMRLTGSIVLLVVTVVTFISTSLALRTQFFVLTAIVLSLVSIVAGVGRHVHEATEPAMAAIPEAAPFIALFAIFFPAVTGFEAGVSMSGDLRDPKRAIPLGSMAAILVGLVVYVALASFLALTVSADALVGNPQVLTEIAWIGPLVLAGVWGATLSSALGSILGAPRILQATALDRITPGFFGAGSGQAREPRRALMVTFLIAWAGILIGELDTIARVVSMFFIATYGFLNLSCAIESWASPDFRPALRVPRFVSVLGAVACLVVMIQLDVLAMIGATVVLGALYFLLARKQLRLESGDAWEGFWSSVVRAALHRLDRSPPHKRNWRPNVLLFAGPEGGRTHLMEFGRELAGRRGMVTNFHMVERPELGDEATGIEPVDLDGEEPPYGVFTRRVECENVYEGMADVARFYGYPGVEPNTALMGWPRRARHGDAASRMIRRLVDLDFNVLLLDYKADRGFGARRRVDFWVEPGSEQVGLMLALAGYLAAADQWRNAELRFLAVSDGGAAAGHADARRIAALLDAERLEGEVRVVGTGGRRSAAERLAAEGADADLVVVGLADLGALGGEKGLEAATRAVDAVGTTLLIHAGQDFRDRRIRGPVAPESEPDSEVAAGETAVPLELPDDPRLAAAIEWLDGRLQQLAAERLDGPHAAAYAEHLGLLRGSARLIRQVRGEVEEVEGLEPVKALREARNALGDFLFHSRQLVAAYAREGVAAQAEAQATIVDLLLAESDRIVETCDRTVRGEDGTRVRWRARVRDHLATRLPRAGLILSHDLAVEAARAVSSAQAWFEEVAAVLARLEFSLEGGDRSLSAAIAELRGMATESTRAVEASRESAGRARAALRSAVRDAAARVSADVRRAVSGEGGRRFKQRGRAGAALARRLRAETSAWGASQELMTRTAEAELTLLAFQHRARTVVRRDLEAFLLRIQNGVAARLREIEDSLTKSMEEDAQDRELPPLGEDWQPPSVQAFLDTLMEALRPSTTELPERTEILADPSIAGVLAGEMTEAQGLEVALRSLVELRMETEFVGGLRGRLADADQVLYQAADAAQDAVRLSSIRLAAPDEGDDPRLRSAMVESARDRVRTARKEVGSLQDRIETTVLDQLQGAFEILTPHVLARSAARVPAYVRVLRGREAVSWFQLQRERAREGFAGLMGRLLYQRSAALVAARDLERRDARPAGADLPAFVASVRPDPEALDALPYHYRQLFLGKPAYSRDFWVGWGRERALASAAVERYRRGQGGGLAIVGEPGAGKSALARYLGEESFDRDAVFTVTAPQGRSTDVGEFRARLARALGSGSTAGPTPEETLGKLRDAVVILEDVTLWWERSDGGYAVIREILRLIRRHGDRVLFVVVADVHAFRFIEAAEGLDPALLPVIECGRFSAREIGEVIELRHSSTGLVFAYDGRLEDDLSTWRRARLFNRIFDYSRGAIGTALQAWIAHIRDVSGDRLEVVAPARPDLEPLDALRPTQVLLLIQVILHGALDRGRLARLCPLDPRDLEREVDVLLQIGLLHESRPGLVSIDPFVRPHLIAWCADRELLP